MKSNFGSFMYFYSFLKYRIFISVGLSLMVGVLDGFGLAMFLPLLQMLDGDNQVAKADNMGNMNFLITGIEKIGIEVNLTNILLVMLSFFVMKGVVKFFESYYKLVLQLFFTEKIRFSNINLLCGLKYSSFVNSDSGRIQNTFSGEVEKVIQAYRNYFSAFQYGVLVFVYIVMAFAVNPQFALLVSFGGWLTNFVFRRFYVFTKKNSKSLTKELHVFQGLLLQMVSNFKYLKATGLVKPFSMKLIKSIKNTQKSQLKIGMLSTWQSAMKEPTVMLVIVLVILIQVNWFNQPLGLIILSLLFFYRSLSFLMALQNYWSSFLAVSGSMENMSEFTEELTKNQSVNGHEAVSLNIKTLELHSLSYKYGDKVILDDISFKITNNETIALVGESGAGKTTLMNILSGLLHVSENMYHIDGCDSNNIDLSSFQKHIGYITQEPVIFNDTVFNNVTFWDEPSDENIERFHTALRKASLFDYIASLPNKENTFLGDNGVLVSGGQKQRISIARELYKDVQILFMDEATSSLDSQTEHEIQASLDLLKGQFITIIVAHRLSTIKNADKIVYLENGKINCIGDFDSLKNMSAGFRKMASLQEL